MQLFLLRHSIATQHSPTGGDRGRPLSTEGFEVLRGEKFAKATVLLDIPALIVSSTYLRARQTAAIVAERIGYQGEILQSEAFTPDASPRELWQEVRELAGATSAGSILVVAHEPLLSSACSWILGSTKREVEFAPATLVAIELSGALKPQPRGKLLQVVHAR